MIEQLIDQAPVLVIIIGLFAWLRADIRHIARLQTEQGERLARVEGLIQGLLSPRHIEPTSVD